MDQKLYIDRRGASSPKKKPGQGVEVDKVGGYMAVIRKHYATEIFCPRNPKTRSGCNLVLSQMWKSVPFVRNIFWAPPATKEISRPNRLEKLARDSGPKTSHQRRWEGRRLMLGTLPTGHTLLFENGLVTYQREKLGILWKIAQIQFIKTTPKIRKDTSNFTAFCYFVIGEKRLWSRHICTQ